MNPTKSDIAAAEVILTWLNYDQEEGKSPFIEKLATIIATHMQAERFKAQQILDTLILILPMAKGYTAQNQVGNNEQFIEIAEKVIRGHPTTELSRLREENKAMRKSLDRYGNHDADCKGDTLNIGDCQCGYSKALTPPAAQGGESK